MLSSSLFSLIWDFRLEKVVSINVSGHKYGLVYPGVGWCVWRDPEFLPKGEPYNLRYALRFAYEFYRAHLQHQVSVMCLSFRSCLVDRHYITPLDYLALLTLFLFTCSYLGADQASFTLNFSRGASQVIGQYYQLIRLGKTGYRSIMFNLTRTADYLAASVEKMGFILMSKTRGAGLPLVAFRLNPAENHKFDEFAIAHQLRERGWVVRQFKDAKEDRAYLEALHNPQIVRETY